MKINNQEIARCQICGASIADDEKGLVYKSDGNVVFCCQYGD